MTFKAKLWKETIKDGFSCFSFFHIEILHRSHPRSEFLCSTRTVASYIFRWPGCRNNSSPEAKVYVPERFWVPSSGILHRLPLTKLCFFSSQRWLLIIHPRNQTDRCYWVQRCWLFYVHFRSPNFDLSVRFFAVFWYFHCIAWIQIKHHSLYFHLLKGLHQHLIQSSEYRWLLRKFF